MYAMTFHDLSLLMFVLWSIPHPRLCTQRVVLSSNDDYIYGTDTVLSQQF